MSVVHVTRFTFKCDYQKKTCEKKFAAFKKDANKKISLNEKKDYSVWEVCATSMLNKNSKA